ncbi:MAG: hypothetical protein ACYCZO_10085 [Daejeonella sp.]
MERILVKEDLQKVKLIDQSYDQEKALLKSKVFAFKTKFDRLDIGELDTKTYLQIINNGLEAYTNKSTKQAYDQLSAAGLTSEAITGPAMARQNVFVSEASSGLNNLLSYRIRKPLYPGMNIALDNIDIVNGLPVIKKEVDLEEIKDQDARQYINTEVGLILHQKAAELADLLNSINDILRSNGTYNITDLSDFSDLVDYKLCQTYQERLNARLEVNLQGIHDHAKKIADKVTA